MSECKSMTERQLLAYGIGVQINPWTFADLHVLIVSNLGAETADGNEILHGILLRALGSILDDSPTYQLRLAGPEACKPEADQP